MEKELFQLTRVPRVECKKCGIHQVKVPWARKKSGFTLLMDSMIVLMAQKMQVEDIKIPRIL
jgi:transposase